MWQVLLAAAVAGSGFFARRLFNRDGDGDSTFTVTDAPPEQTRPRVRVSKPQLTKNSIPISIGEFNESSSVKQVPNLGKDSIFRFSSQGEVRSGGKKSRKGKEISDGIRKGVEVQKLEKRFSFCLKRRKTGKSASTKERSRCPKDSSSFGWGLGVGIMYMMSAGKAEISKLNKTVDETSKVVQELKSELNKRKSSRSMQVSSSVNNAYANAKHIQPVHFNSTTENRTPNDMKVSVFPVTDDGECASSVLTEEPVPEMLELNQLEAELESELQKLPGCFTEDCGHDVIEPSGFEETEALAKGCHEPEGETSESYRSNGVSPSELDQKLCRLVIEQQESQIMELESELHSSKSKLCEKETELQALKDCVKRLSEFSINVSDDEADANVEQEGNNDLSYNNKVGLNPMNSMVGIKRGIDYESCSYLVR